MSSIVSLLHLPSSSESLWRRSQGARVAGGTLLQHFVRWWADVHRKQSQLTIVTHSAREEATLRHAAAEYGARLLLRPPASDVTVARDLVSETAALAVEVLCAGVMLLPDSCLMRLRHHHRTTGNDFTECIGTPRDASPFILSSPLLDLVADLPTRDGNWNLPAIVRELKRVAEACGEVKELSQLVRQK